MFSLPRKMETSLTVACHFGLDTVSDVQYVWLQGSVTVRHRSHAQALRFHPHKSEPSALNGRGL